MTFEIGTNNFKKRFECGICAVHYYNDLQEEKKYLKDIKNNIILLNTYGWKNETKIQ